MNEHYTIDYEEKPEESAWGIIGSGVHNFNTAQAGDQKFHRLCYVLRGPDQEIVGGVLGEIYWEWFYVDLMWIKEDLRGQGYGRRLLDKIEEAARKHGARHAYLDTFSFQAPGFYEKLGYRVFGELPDFPPGQQRFFLTKDL